MRLVIAAILLSSCAVANDDVAWTGKIIWRETETPTTECDRLIGNFGLRFGRAVSGCMLMQPNGTCYIITEPLKNEQALITLGHEVKHCRDGDFHR